MPGPPHGQTHPAGCITRSGRCLCLELPAKLLELLGQLVDLRLIGLLRGLGLDQVCHCAVDFGPQRRHLPMRRPWLPPSCCPATWSPSCPRPSRGRRGCTRMRPSSRKSVRVSWSTPFRTFTQRSAPCKFCTPVRAYPTHSCNGWWAVCGFRIRRIGPKARKPPDPTPQDAFLA